MKLNSWSWIHEFVKLKSWFREVEIVNSWSWSLELMKLKCHYRSFVRNTIACSYKNTDMIWQPQLFLTILWADRTGDKLTIYFLILLPENRLWRFARKGKIYFLVKVRKTLKKMFCVESFTQHETNSLKHLYNWVRYSTIVDINQFTNGQPASILLKSTLYIQSNLDGSNTDGSFTMANSDSFLSPYEILPIAQENKYLRKFSYFIVKLYVLCTH